MQGPVGPRDVASGNCKESLASLPLSCGGSSGNSSPNRPAPTEATATWSGSDRTAVGGEAVVGYGSGCSTNSSYKQSARRPSFSRVGGGDTSTMNGVVKRSCAEEEAFQRGRIYLQQLESWKDLRVRLLKEQPGSLACSRSTSLRSLSTATRQENTMCSPPRWQRRQSLQVEPSKLQREPAMARSQPSPPPKQVLVYPAPSSVQQHTPQPRRSSAVSWRGCDSEWGGARLLEKYYEGEVRRVAQRGQRLQEREWRMMERQLHDARAAEARALEEARVSSERVRALEGQLHAAQQTLVGVSASNREVLGDLQLRDRQVEVLSVEVERLRVENVSLAVERRKVETAMRERVGELEAAAKANKQSEAALAARLREAECELSEQQRARKERDEALSRELEAQQMVQERITEMVRQLREVTTAVDNERHEAERQAKALQQSQDMCEELLQRCREKGQELTEQAEHYEAIIAARVASTASATAQLEKEISIYKRQYRELRKQLAQERVSMATVAERQRDEVLNLRRAVNVLQTELLSKPEGSFAYTEDTHLRQWEEVTHRVPHNVHSRGTGHEVAGSCQPFADARRKLHCLGGAPRSVPVHHGQKQKQTKALRQKKQRQRRSSSVPDNGSVISQRGVSNMPLKECISTGNADGLADEDSSHHCDGGVRCAEQPYILHRADGDGEERSPSIRNGTVPHDVNRPSSSLSEGDRVNERKCRRDVTPKEAEDICLQRTTSDVIKCIEKRLELYLPELEAKVVDAVSTVLVAGGYGATRQSQLQSQGTGDHQAHLVNSPSRRGTAPPVGETTLTVDCVVKLLEAVSALNVVLPYFESLSYQAASDGVLRGVDRRLVEYLRGQQRSLNAVTQAMDLRRKEALGELESGVANVCDATVRDPLIPTLVAALEERLETLLTMADVGSWVPPKMNGMNASTCPPFDNDICVSVNTEAAAFKQATSSPHKDPEAEQQRLAQSSPSSPPKDLRNGDALPRHTFGAVGGRVEVSEDGRSIRRLQLPCVVDIISCSALGALSHQSFSVCHHAGSPASPSPNLLPCFTYTIRITAPCADALVGLSDGQLPLETFPPALNSLSYPNCYFLHLGYGTLYCPRLSIVARPYPGFMRSGPLQLGEEVSCVFNVWSRTIRFMRGATDCGVAFEDVETLQPLFPAFEFNSGSGAVEFA